MSDSPFDRYMRSPYGKRSEEPIQTWTGRVENAPDIEPQEPFIREDKSKEPPWPVISDTARQEVLGDDAGKSGQLPVSSDGPQQPTNPVSGSSQGTFIDGRGQQYVQHPYVWNQASSPQYQPYQQPPWQEYPAGEQYRSGQSPYYQNYQRPVGPYQAQHQQAQIPEKQFPYQPQGQFGDRQYSGQGYTGQYQNPQYGQSLGYQQAPVQQTDAPHSGGRFHRSKREKVSEPKRITWKTWAAVIVLVPLVVLSAYLVTELNGGSLDLTDREVRVIMTDSMDGGPTDWPISTIPQGSLVMIHKLNDEGLAKLQTGDVLAYTSFGSVYTHRILENHVQEKYFETKGDNAKASETESYAASVGEVIGVNPWLGKIMMFLSKNGIFLAALLLIILVSSTLIRRILAGSAEGVGNHT